MSAYSAVIPVASPFPVAVPTSSVPAPSIPQYSLEDYFELERRSEIRHEYVAGEIISMTGESLAHNQIAGNFHTRFALAFADRDCSVYMEGVRVRVSPVKYRYPDIVALCGTPATDGDNPPALLNPALIVEVLSASTQVTDRGEKLFEYQQISGLTDYVLVAQETLSVFHFARQHARQWTMTEYITLADTLTFTLLAVSITLADIYRKVTFPPANTPEPATSPS